MHSRHVGSATGSSKLAIVLSTGVHWRAERLISNGMQCEGFRSGKRDTKPLGFGSGRLSHAQNPSRRPGVGLLFFFVGEERMLNVWFLLGLLGSLFIATMEACSAASCAFQWVSSDAFRRRHQRWCPHAYEAAVCKALSTMPGSGRSSRTSQWRFRTDSSSPSIFRTASPWNSIQITNDVTDFGASKARRLLFISRSFAYLSTPWSVFAEPNRRLYDSR